MRLTDPVTLKMHLKLRNKVEIHMLSWARCLDQRVSITCREVSFTYYAVVKQQGARSSPAPRTWCVSVYISTLQLFSIKKS
jgi:hypothetical protein